MFHLHRQVGMKTEHRGWSETSACKIQTTGNYPEENTTCFEFLCKFLGSVTDREVGRTFNPYPANAENMVSC